MGEEAEQFSDLGNSSEIRKSSENTGIDKELDRIRLRRTDKNKKFPKTFDDAVLIFGLLQVYIFWRCHFIVFRNVSWRFNLLR